MPLSSLQAFRKLAIMGAYELTALRKRCYPRFVFDSTTKALNDEIPVFLFHSVEGNDLEEKLGYLVTNGYQTIGADELYDYLTGRKRNPRNAVVLTFDDGRGSLWSVAYPLLKKYGLVGVAFIVPNWINNTDRYYPNLEDYWEGAGSFSDIKSRESSSCPIVTWREIREMHASGNIDFQSHTLNHSMVFTSDVIVNFINPGFNFGFYHSLVPVSEKDRQGRNPEMGTPIYTMAPRLFGTRRYVDDEHVRDLCISYVKENGGESFFKRVNWRKKLERIVRGYKEKNALKHRYENDAEREEAILYELRESKRIIENRIPGKSVNHLCYPYFAGSDLSVKLSEKSGYVSNFWGWDMFSIQRPSGYATQRYLMGYQTWESHTIRGKRTNSTGGDPYRIVRLPGDYIFRLPGKGRRSILQIMTTKCFRLLRKNTFALLTLGFHSS
jgi:hypothetical protein